MSLVIDTGDGSHCSWQDDKESNEDAAILRRFDDMFKEQLVDVSHEKFVLPLKRLNVIGRLQIYLLPHDDYRRRESGCG